jgi:hypothetical protein
MDRNAIFWAARLLVGGIGVLLMFIAVRLLGRARAAANWPTAPPVATLARPLGWAGIGAGLVGLAAAAALSLAALAGPPDPAPMPHTWRGWLLAGTAALVVLTIGASTARRLVARAELTTLIRTPPRPGYANREDPNPPTLVPPAPVLPAQAGPDGPAGQNEPAIPPGGRSGWVYRDPAGDWYLAVAADGGQRLVRLTDFTLVPVGTAGEPLALAGSAEISVWPVTDRATDAP